MSVGAPRRYQLGDEQVLLEETDFVAIDVAGVEPSVLTRVHTVAEPLRNDLVLVHRDTLDGGRAGCLTGLRQYRVLRYRDGTLVVVLPELIIETDSDSQRDDITRWAHRHGIDQLDPSRAGLVLHVPTTSTDDALDLADALSRQFQVLLAQPHFVRLIGRPDVTPPRTDSPAPRRLKTPS